MKDWTEEEQARWNSMVLLGSMSVVSFALITYSFISVSQLSYEQSLSNLLLLMGLAAISSLLSGVTWSPDKVLIIHDYDTGAGLSIAALAYYGLSGAVLISTTVVLVVWLLHKGRYHASKRSYAQLILNVGTLNITSLFAYLAFNLVVSQLGDIASATMFGWISAAIVYELANHAMLTIIIQIRINPNEDGRRLSFVNNWTTRLLTVLPIRINPNEDRRRLSFVNNWTTRLLTIMTNFVGAGLVGYAMRAHDWRGIVIFFIPLLLSSTAYLIHMRHNGAYMDDLEELVQKRTASLVAITREMDALYNPNEDKRINLKKVETNEYLNEVKLLLVGQSSVGKTSLKNRLLFDSFAPLSESTDGVDVDRWRLQVAGNDIQINVWDFGGQEIYHATHQFFLTERSVYLVVIDARQGQFNSRLEYWLTMAESYGGDAPIVVVINKCDERLITLDERGLSRKHHTIDAFVYTSCMDSTGIEQLKAAITSVVSRRIPHVQIPIESNWRKVKLHLETTQLDYITYERYELICRQFEIIEHSEQIALLRFLHDLGVVLSFQDDQRLSYTHVLNPKWVTNGVYAILSSKESSENLGLMNSTRMAMLLEGSAYPSHKHQYIISLMQKFELCFAVQNDDAYIIPDLLQKQEPKVKFDETNALQFQLHYDVLPTSIISRFIVRMHSFIEHLDWCWFSGVVLTLGRNRALIRADFEEKVIQIWIEGRTNTRRHLLSIVRAQFGQIHASVSALNVVEVVPIPKMEEHTITYAELLNLEENNIENYFYARIGSQINVPQLLNGIETSAERSLTSLHSKVMSHLSMTDLKMICFRMSVEFYDVQTETKSDTVRKLIFYLERRGLLPKLIDICRKERPSVKW
ncbi:MAG: COR domain-containing protein [Candidatus Promineifilaceae bacterium]